MSLFLLFESAAGYSLFEEKESEEIAEHLGDAQKSINDYSKFSKMVKLVAFESFVSSEQALENINAISEGILPEKLRFFLESNFPKPKKGKSAKVQLGVSEEKLATAIQDTLEFGCNRSQKVLELLRGIRLHFSKFIKELKEGDVEKTQLGLAHSYSRCKIKFNINRADNHIIQAISLLDQLDKDINTFAMRVREWYGWHFPELIKVVPDNIVYARIVNVLGSRATVTDEKVAQLAKLLTDEDKAKEVIEASKSSMGTDISDLDMLNISRFALKVVHLDEYRQKLHNYLHDKMSNVAPNLASLIGDIVGARLISHAGSLVNLAKYPASTVQILGAEKALFRALKTRGNTPKYGLIFHSSFIGKAQTRDKGRISRYLANKCSIASRIDYFSETGTTIYGEKLKDQVEERLDFYKTGKAPRTNAEVIEEIKKSLKDQNAMKDDTESESETDAPANKSAKSPKTPKKSKDAEEPKTPKSSKKSKEVETPKSSKKTKEVETPKSSKKSKKDEEEPKTPKKSKDAEEPKTPKSSKKSKEVETPKSSKKSKDVETPKSSKKSKKDEDSDSDAPLTGKKRKAEVATPKSEKRRKQ